MAVHLSTRQHNTSDRTACRSLQGREKRATQRENITRHSYLSGNPFRPNPIPTCPFIPSLQTVPNPHYRAMKVRDGMDSSKKTRKHQTARLNQESEASEKAIIAVNATCEESNTPCVAPETAISLMICATSYIWCSLTSCAG